MPMRLVNRSCTAQKVSRHCSSDSGSTAVIRASMACCTSAGTCHPVLFKACMRTTKECFLACSFIGRVPVAPQTLGQRVTVTCRNCGVMQNMHEFFPQHIAFAGATQPAGMPCLSVSVSPDEALIDFTGAK